MNYEEFKNEVTSRIKEFLPEKYADASVSIQSVVKNNDQKLDGLMVSTDDSSITPNIYLDQYFEQYENGREMDEILQNIADVRVSHEMEQDFNVSSITDFDKVKDHIIPSLINAEMNESYLSDKPHIMVNDLAVVYKIDLGTSESGAMTAPITNNLMEQYGVSVEEIDSHAMANLMTQPMSFKSMRDTLVEMMGGDVPDFMLPPEEENPLMYVLSNESKLGGANMILDSGKMDEIAEKIGGDFIVIPSSIHEVIIMPINDSMDLREINSMINDVNAGQVAPAERLSDKAYGYDAEKSLLVYASDLSAFKENEVVQEEQKEVKGDIAEKTEEAIRDAGLDIKLSVSDKLVSDPFVSPKDGNEYCRIKVPNEDRNDKSSWASFVVPAADVSDGADGKKEISLPKDGNKTLYTPKVTGYDQSNKPIYVNEKEKISNADLMNRFEKLSSPQKELTTITFSEKLKGEPFTNKNGTELVSIKIPNEDKTDHSPWFEAVVPSSHVKEAGNGKISVDFPANSEITASRSVVQGVDDAGKKVFGRESIKIPVEDLKKRLEPSKTNIKDMIKSGKEKIQAAPDRKDKDKTHSRGGEAI